MECPPRGILRSCKQEGYLDILSWSYQLNKILSKKIKMTKYNSILTFM